MQGLDADPFLPKAGTPDSLLSDVEQVLGHDFLQGRLRSVETYLEPMFRSLPKNSRNVLSHATARYALHRISADQHGWTIHGLEDSMGNSNLSSIVTSGIVSSLLPAQIESIFEKHVDAVGFNLRSLAILAGTIDYLVRQDQYLALRKACEVLSLPTIGSMGEDDMKTIIQLYMATFLTPLAKPSLKLLKSMNRSYPGWTDMVLLLDDERGALYFNERNWANPFRGKGSSLQVALRVVQQAADQYQKHQYEPECQEIKNDILAYERGDTGRVRLVDFYRADLDSRFWYVESKDYLRAVGALDESDSQLGPKVIVSNYVLAKSNCVAEARMYSICCSNECEGLYGQLERSLEAPEATPQQVGAHVSHMSSSTVQAPRNLSQLLLRRLDDIANERTGKVLLHGRLFAQWMHQAFPRECPYPHLAGTTTSMGPRQWKKQTGLQYRVDVGGGNVTSHIAALEAEENVGAESLADVGDMDLMWTPDEEYFVEPPQPLFAHGAFGPVVAFLSLCVILMLAMYATPAKSGRSNKANHEYQFFV